MSDQSQCQVSEQNVVAFTSMLIFNSSPGASFEKRCADDERGEEKFWFEKLINTTVDGRLNDSVSKNDGIIKIRGG